MVPGAPKLALIGFGEAAMAFARDWAGGVDARAYDILTGDPSRAEAKREDYARFAIVGADRLEHCLDGAKAVLSLVTADQAGRAARTAARFIGVGAYYFDGNSVAPRTKQAAAKAIEQAGGHYVDLAIMAPVHSKGTGAPLLISGPHAEAGAELLVALGFAPRIAGDRVGQASLIKMLRSIIVKGTEALTAECFLAAAQEGVAQAVADSLGSDWLDKADYNLDRMLVHGLRRAAEMEEVVATLQALGAPAGMARAAAIWQRRIGELGLSPADGFDAKARQIRSGGRRAA